MKWLNRFRKKKEQPKIKAVNVLERNTLLVISPILKDKKLIGIVHGERVDKADHLTVNNFDEVRYLGESVNAKKKDKTFFHAVGKVGGRSYFLIFE